HLLWAAIRGGEEVFAYIQNLAADGAHYWVLAHVTPTRDAHGTTVAYHSNRRRPAASALPVVQDLYRRAGALDAGGGGAAGAEGAAEAFLDLLAEEGVTFRHLVWSPEPEEALG